MAWMVKEIGRDSSNVVVPTFSQFSILNRGKGILEDELNQQKAQQTKTREPRKMQCGKSM
jgi:hypothetical protein